jgi:hypothetical protein
MKDGKISAPKTICSGTMISDTTRLDALQRIADIGINLGVQARWSTTGRGFRLCQAPDLYCKSHNIRKELDRFIEENKL